MWSPCPAESRSEEVGEDDYGKGLGEPSQSLISALSKLPSEQSIPLLTGFENCFNLCRPACPSLSIFGFFLLLPYTPASLQSYPFLKLPSFSLTRLCIHQKCSCPPLLVQIILSFRLQHKCSLLWTTHLTSGFSPPDPSPLLPVAMTFCLMHLEAFLSLSSLWGPMWV